MYTPTAYEMVITLVVAFAGFSAFSVVRLLTKRHRSSSVSRPEFLERALKGIEERSNYNTVLRACANAVPSRPEDAEKVLAKMEQEGVKPNSISYNHLLKAYANAKNLDIHDAEDVVTRMRQANIQPNLMCYNTLLTCYANATPVAIDRAEQLFKQMTTSDIECDTVTYNCLLHAYANARPAMP